MLADATYYSYLKDKRLLVLLLFCALISVPHFLSILLPTEQANPKNWLWVENTSGRDGYHLLRIAVTDPSVVETVGQRHFTPRAAFLLGRRFPINRADYNELQMLPGIGPKLAQRILSYRHQSGTLQNSESLLHIRGIGPILKERLAPLLRFDDRVRAHGS